MSNMEKEAHSDSTKPSVEVDRSFPKTISMEEFNRWQAEPTKILTFGPDFAEPLNEDDFRELRFMSDAYLQRKEPTSLGMRR